VQQVQAAEMNRKRKLELAEKESLELFLTQLGSEEAVGASGGLADLDVGLKHKGSDEKEAKMDTARNKACRERARRERLNDRCSFSRKAVLGLAAHAQQRLQCQAHTQFLVHVSCAQHHHVPQLRRALQGFGPSQGRQDWQDQHRCWCHPRRHTAQGRERAAQAAQQVSRGKGEPAF